MQFKLSSLFKICLNRHIIDREILNQHKFIFHHCIKVTHNHCNGSDHFTVCSGSKCRIFLC